MGESGSSISSEQQEEAGELSRMEVVCESGEVINLEALACLLRMLGLALSAVMNRLMEPTADWWEAEDFPGRLPRVERGPDALDGIAEFLGRWLDGALLRYVHSVPCVGHAPCYFLLLEVHATSCHFWFCHFLPVECTLVFRTRNSSAQGSVAILLELP